MIKIDMEMPKSCIDCPFLHHDYFGDFTCGAQDFETIDYVEGERADDCPLEEVEDSGSSSD